MTVTLTDLQYRILEHIVENSDLRLERFNRAEDLTEDLEPPATITDVQLALKVLETRGFITNSSAKVYSPTPKGRDEL